MYQHITTLDQFRELSEPDQRACAAERKAETRAQLEKMVSEAYSRLELERSLIPQLPVRPATSAPEVVSLHPEVPQDIDSRVRLFFEQNPQTREIRVGNTVYERRVR